MTLNPATIAILVMIPLIGWRLYSRLRRLVGRQKLSRFRPWITVTLFPTLIVLVAWSSRMGAESLVWLGGGIAAGAMLAMYALRLTRFEPTAEGLFYTPNAHLGIALSLLMLGRVGYRMFEVATAGPMLARNNADFIRSPLTLVILGLLAGYYVSYAAGLIRWRRAVMRERAAPPTRD